MHQNSDWTPIFGTMKMTEVMHCKVPHISKEQLHPLVDIFRYSTRRATHSIDSVGKLDHSKEAKSKTNSHVFFGRHFSTCITINRSRWMTRSFEQDRQSNVSNEQYLCNNMFSQVVNLNEQQEKRREEVRRSSKAVNQIDYNLAFLSSRFAIVSR